MPIPLREWDKATLNLSKKGVQTTVGLPGSGLSYRSRRRPWDAAAEASPPSAPASAGAAPPAGRGAVAGALIATLALLVFLALMLAG